MPRLDGLRAVAVAAVLFTHYLPRESWPFDIYWGGLGVQLFFVLSGFLITQLLWLARERIEEGSRTFGRELGQFLMRRMIRLAPALWAVLGVAALLDLTPVRRTFAWHVSYLSNFYFLRLGAWDAQVSHLWSLALEEQFYLIWALVVLLVPRDKLVIPILLGISIGPAYRALALGLDWPPMATWVMVPAFMDFLGGGALLAWLVRARRSGGRRVGRALHWAGLGGALLFAAGNLLDFEVLAPFVKIFEGCFVSAFFVLAVWRASERKGTAVGRILEWKPFVAMGRISYGIYLIHAFPPEVFDRTIAGPAGAPSWGRPAFATVATIASAVLLWYGVERPLQRLKSKFA